MRSDETCFAVSQSSNGSEIAVSDFFRVLKTAPSSTELGKSARIGGRQLPRREDARHGDLHTSKFVHAECLRVQSNRQIRFQIWMIRASAAQHSFGIQLGCKLVRGRKIALQSLCCFSVSTLSKYHIRGFGLLGSRLILNVVRLHCHVHDVDSYGLAKVNLSSVMNALYRLQVFRKPVLPDLHRNILQLEHLSRIRELAIIISRLPNLQLK